MVVSLGRDPVTGKRRQLWRSVRGPKREAEALLVQLLHQRDTGIDQPPGKITVGQFLARWLEDYATPNLAPKTFRSYPDVVHRHLIPALGSIPLARLRPSTFRPITLAPWRAEGLMGRVDSRRRRSFATTRCCTSPLDTLSSGSSLRATPATPYNRHGQSVMRYGPWGRRPSGDSFGLPMPLPGAPWCTWRSRRACARESC